MPLIVRFIVFLISLVRDFFKLVFHIALVPHFPRALLGADWRLASLVLWLVELLSAHGTRGCVYVEFIQVAEFIAVVSANLSAFLELSDLDASDFLRDFQPTVSTELGHTQPMPRKL